MVLAPLSSEETEAPRSRSKDGLRRPDFRLISRAGFGDGINHYAHSMAWFEDNLYIGISRATMHANKINIPKPDLSPWPVDCPDDIRDVERRTEIWRYNPRINQWRRVYRAPMVQGRDGNPWPRYISFRGMAVFQGKGDPKPCLYVSSWSPLLCDPPDILRSEDGLNFAPAARPPFDASVRSFRTLQPFNDRIHTTPTSSGAINLQRMLERRSQDSVGGNSTIYATDDIASGQWTATCEEGFGDPANLTVFEMANFNGHLYAGTVNPNGMQLWRTVDDRPPPYRWKKVLDCGAWRGPANEVGVGLCVFKGALYVSTGVLNGGYHRKLRIGPYAAELMRVWPDDSWELLVGQSRLTPDGLRYPLSGYSAGFDNLFGGYIWRMCEHDGWLYAGTFSWAMTLPYLPRHFWPEDVATLIQRWGIDKLCYDYGGCELWRSPDGVRWSPVTRDGFGNPYNWGIRTMASTAQGFFVGTANPFGPTIAQKRDGRWRYVPNPRGGLEIYRAPGTA
jgi:hypothetical protein